MGAVYDRLGISDRMSLKQTILRALDKLAGDGDGSVDNEEAESLILSGSIPTEQRFDAKALQNRDRSRQSYVTQMQKIASDPDYDRISTSKTPDTGAPMVFVRGASIPATQSGKKETITMADGKGGTVKIPAIYAVVEADSAIASHDAGGSKVDAYGGDTGVMALNNGRTAALKQAYKKGTAGGYREALKADTAGHGIDATTIDKMKSPVLVRVFSEASIAGIEDPGTASNISAGAQLSASEQAESDAKRLNESVVMQYAGGDINSNANRDFVRAFIQSLGGSDAAGDMQTGDGLISAAGIKRIEGALVAKAYGDQSILIDLTENPDDDLKSLGNVLKDVAGRWSVMKEAAQAGGVASAVDITENLTEAIVMIRKARQQGVRLSELVNQNDMFSGGINPVTEQLLRLMFRGDDFNRVRSAEKIKKALHGFLDKAMATTEGADMFGYQADPIELINQQKDTLEAEENAGKAQKGLFDSIADYFESWADVLDEDDFSTEEGFNSMSAIPVFDSLSFREQRKVRGSVLTSLEKLGDDSIGLRESRKLRRDVLEGLELLGGDATDDQSKESALNDKPVIQAVNFNENYEKILEKGKAWMGAAQNAASALQNAGEFNITQWQDLTSKTAFDQYLMREFNISHADARRITNTVGGRGDKSASFHDFAGEAWADLAINLGNEELKTGLPDSGKFKHLEKQLEKAGWFTDYMDVDLTKDNPKIEMSLRTASGLMIFARSDSNNKATIEVSKRTKKLGESRFFGQNSPRTYNIDDQLITRLRPEGGRSMLREVAEILAENSNGALDLNSSKELMRGLLNPNADQFHEELKGEIAAEGSSTTPMHPPAPIAPGNSIELTTKDGKKAVFTHYNNDPAMWGNKAVEKYQANIVVHDMDASPDSFIDSHFKLHINIRRSDGKAEASQVNTRLSSRSSIGEFDSWEEAMNIGINYAKLKGDADTDSNTAQGNNTKENTLKVHSGAGEHAKYILNNSNYAKEMKAGNLDDHEDILDSYFSDRVVDVRNALRELGWDGEPYKALSKNGHEYSPRWTKNSGDFNVVGMEHAFTGIKMFIRDDFERTAGEMASLINTRFEQEVGTYKSQGDDKKDEAQSPNDSWESNKAVQDVMATMREKNKSKLTLLSMASDGNFKSVDANADPYGISASYGLREAIKKYVDDAGDNITIKDINALIEFIYQKHKENDDLSPIPRQYAADYARKLEEKRAELEGVTARVITTKDIEFYRSSPSPEDDFLESDEYDFDSFTSARIFSDRVAEESHKRRSREYERSDKHDVGSKVANALKKHGFKSVYKEGDIHNAKYAERKVSNGRVYVSVGDTGERYGTKEKEGVIEVRVGFSSDGRRNSRNLQPKYWQINVNTGVVNDVTMDGLDSGVNIIVEGIAEYAASLETVVDTSNTPGYGSKYSSELRNGKDIAKELRGIFKAAVKSGELPKDVKLGIRSSYNNIDITVKSLPDSIRLFSDAYLKWREERENEWDSLPHSIPRYSDEYAALEYFLESHANAFNYDNSDTMTDYFDTNFYLSVEPDRELSKREEQREVSRSAPSQPAQSKTDAEVVADKPVEPEAVKSLQSIIDGAHDSKPTKEVLELIKSAKSELDTAGVLPEYAQKGGLIDLAVQKFAQLTKASA